MNATNRLNFQGGKPSVCHVCQVVTTRPSPSAQSFKSHLRRKSRGTGGGAEPKPPFIWRPVEAAPQHCAKEGGSATLVWVGGSATLVIGRRLRNTGKRRRLRNNGIRRRLSNTGEGRWLCNTGEGRWLCNTVLVLGSGSVALILGGDSATPI